MFDSFICWWHGRLLSKSSKYYASFYLIVSWNGAIQIILQLTSKRLNAFISQQASVVRNLFFATSKGCVRFLGVFLDHNLRWFNHIDSVCSKLNSSFFAISRVRHLLPMSSLINIYLHLNYILYNIPLCGNSSEVGRVFVFQKWIIYDITPRSSCKPVFEEKVLTHCLVLSFPKSWYKLY